MYTICLLFYLKIFNCCHPLKCLKKCENDWINSIMIGPSPRSSGQRKGAVCSRVAGWATPTTARRSRSARWTSRTKGPTSAPQATGWEHPHHSPWQSRSKVQTPFSSLCFFCMHSGNWVLSNPIHCNTKKGEITQMCKKTKQNFCCSPMMIGSLVNS